MNPNLPTPDIRHDDPSERLKSELLAAARKGWHCPRDIRIVDRISKFLDKTAEEFDPAFYEELMHINDTWFYDLGYDPDTGYQSRRQF